MGNCEHILPEGITIRDSLFWPIYSTYCRHVIIRGVTVDSVNFNNNGCDPDACSDVLIEKCVFPNGDDGIAIKSGCDQDRLRVARPTECVLVRNCEFLLRVGPGLAWSRPKPWPSVKGVYWTAKHGFEALKASRGCSLNTSSLVGEIGQEIHAAYAATKGAMNALTKSMALDYAVQGIRVNAVCPAGVWTPMLRQWASEQPDPAGLLVFSGYPQAITKSLCALFKRMPKLLRVPPTAFCS